MNLLAEQALWQAALADHGFQRSGDDLVCPTVRRQVDHPDLPAVHAAIATVARPVMTMQDEAMSLDDFEKSLVCAD